MNKKKEPKTEKSKPEPTKLEDDSLKFLLEELETLRSLRSNMNSLGESRVNILLAVSGGLFGLALFKLSSNSQEEVSFLINGVVLIGLLFLGLITFGRTIERDINIKIYTRGLNRIRNYFANQDPPLKKHLILPIYDDQPKFNTLGLSNNFIGQFFSLESMVVIINSTLATVAVLALTKRIPEMIINCILATEDVSNLTKKILESVQIVSIAIIAILTFLVVCFIQYFYMYIRFEKVERDYKKKIEFPSFFPHK